MNVSQVLKEIEAAGVAVRLEERISIWFPGTEHREKLIRQLVFLRERREEVANLLRSRGTVPAMPPGVRLLSWNLKEPPVAIEASSVVSDPAKFAGKTLEQLGHSLKNPRRWVGWSVPQLIDRLAQVGVVVVLRSDTDVYSMGTGGDGADRAGTAEAQPAT